MESVWINGQFNKETATRNIKAFLAVMENPEKVGTRAQFEQVEKDLKTFVEQRLAQ